MAMVIAALETSIAAGAAAASAFLSLVAVTRSAAATRRADEQRLLAEHDERTRLNEREWEHVAEIIVEIAHFDMAVMAHSQRELRIAASRLAAMRARLRVALTAALAWEEAYWAILQEAAAEAGGPSPRDPTRLQMCYALADGEVSALDNPEQALHEVEKEILRAVGNHFTYRRLVAEDRERSTWRKLAVWLQS